MMPDPSERGWQFTGCFQSIFLETDANKIAKVSSTNAATESWYKGADSYDYVLNKAKTTSTGFVEETVGCSQSIALQYRYNHNSNRFESAHPPKIAGKKMNFLDCQKDCYTTTDCAGFETGPKDHCVIYKFSSETRTKA